MLVMAGWLFALSSAYPGAGTVLVPAQEIGARRQTAAPISVWADREQPYRRGEDVRVFFQAEEPGYVTILRVDTDGRIRTLYPREPWRQTEVRGKRTLEIADSRRRPSFVVEDGPGIGYLFAVISPYPFEYADITRGDYWDFRVVGNGRIRGDPYVALTDLARRISSRGSYRYDIAPYYVERRYQYPRFACYDCHSYASYDEWDPYAAACVRYRVVIYDDPAYYPYRYNEGRTVVSARPLRPAPRYVFKDARTGVEYVTRLRQRESHEVRRSRIDPNRTSADIGGAGAVPVPGGRAERGPVLRRDVAEPSAERPEGNRAGRRSGDAERRKVPPVQRGARNPKGTGEPELRRRKP